MSKFDQIIGYAAIKKELRQIADTLKNREAYDRLGVSAPRGLLLYGDPGLGKTLMANAVIEESGRKVFVCRKDQPNGDFVRIIKETFEKAAANAPSIVFLDDMDKFANGDEEHPDAEEYVTVQSCIDAAKNHEVFVLATANNIRCLPESLCRAGRFDRTLEIEAPRGQDVEKIVSHYLSSKKFVEGVNAQTVARIMDGRSCAELETVINEAGLLAGYERSPFITMDHIMEVCLRVIYDVPAAADIDAEQKFFDTLSDADSVGAQIVYHEAGHAVVSEVLCPESVTLVVVHKRGGSNNGITSYYNDRSHTPMCWQKSRIIGALGGMAAIDRKFGIVDIGARADLDYAFDRVSRLVKDHCVCGLQLHCNGYDDTERLKSEQERAVAAEVEQYLCKAKEILARNNEFFEKIAEALSRKLVLTTADIQQIKQQCRIVPVVL